MSEPFDREAYEAACDAEDVPPFDCCAEIELGPRDGRQWSMIRLVDLQTAVAMFAE